MTEWISVFSWFWHWRLCPTAEHYGSRRCCWKCTWRVSPFSFNIVCLVLCVCVTRCHFSCDNDDSEVQKNRFERTDFWQSFTFFLSWREIVNQPFFSGFVFFVCVRRRPCRSKRWSWYETARWCSGQTEKACTGPDDGEELFVITRFLWALISIFQNGWKFATPESQRRSCLGDLKCKSLFRASLPSSANGIKCSSFM